MGRVLWQVVYFAFLIGNIAAPIAAGRAILRRIRAGAVCKLGPAQVSRGACIAALAAVERDTERIVHLVPER
jgi:hypothetical protein